MNGGKETRAACPAVMQISVPGYTVPDFGGQYNQAPMLGADDLARAIIPKRVCAVLLCCMPDPATSAGFV
jgi:hypothetical protein